MSGNPTRSLTPATVHATISPSSRGAESALSEFRSPSPFVARKVRFAAVSVTRFVNHDFDSEHSDSDSDSDPDSDMKPQDVETPLNEAPDEDYIPPPEGYFSRETPFERSPTPFGRPSTPAGPDARSGGRYILPIRRRFPTWKVRENLDIRADMAPPVVHRAGSKGPAMNKEERAWLQESLDTVREQSVELPSMARLQLYLDEANAQAVETVEVDDENEPEQAASSKDTTKAELARLKHNTYPVLDKMFAPKSK